VAGAVKGEMLFGTLRVLAPISRRKSCPSPAAIGQPQVTMRIEWFIHEACVKWFVIVTGTELSAR
jgi:hypothetical protein